MVIWKWKILLKVIKINEEKIYLKRLFRDFKYIKIFKYILFFKVFEKNVCFKGYRDNNNRFLWNKDWFNF